MSRLLARPSHLRRAAAVLATSLAAPLMLLAANALFGPSRLTTSIGGPGWFCGRAPWFESSGFRSPEMSPEGFVFNWTGPEASLRLPHLVRSRPSRIAIRGRAPELEERAMELSLTVDGVVAARARVVGFRLSAPIPARGQPGATVQLRVVEPVAPRPERQRPGAQLGVVVGRVILEADDGQPFAMPRGTLLRASLACALYAAGAALLLPAWGVLAVGLAAAATHSWLLLSEGAFLGDLSSTLVATALAVALLLVLARLVTKLVRRVASEPSFAWALALVIVVTGLKAAFFMHPALPPDDAAYHVGRADRVMEGNLFFTSNTPPPGYAIPYPIALYLLAAPLWSVVRDHEMLLRILTLVAEAAAGLMLYAAVKRRGAEPTAAVWAALLFVTAPILMLRLAVGSLTNNFGQGLYVCGAGALVLGWRCGRVAQATAACLLAAAFLSHFGTLLMGLPLLFVFAAVASWLGEEDSRRLGKVAAIVALVAATLAFALYYVHFIDVVLETATRVLQGSGVAAPAVMDAPPERKLPRALAEIVQGYGFLLPVAVWGIVLARREGRRDALSLLVCSWVGTTVGFLVLGIATPVEVRSLLAGAPVLAVLAADGFARLQSGGVAARSLLAATFTASLAAQGVILAQFLSI